MSSYSCMYLIPRDLYVGIRDGNSSQVKEALGTVNIRQLNNLDVNDGGKVTVRNDDHYPKRTVHLPAKPDGVYDDTPKPPEPFRFNENENGNENGNGNGNENGNGNGNGQDQTAETNFNTDSQTQTNSIPTLNSSDQTENYLTTSSSQTKKPNVNISTETDKILINNKNDQTHFSQNQNSQTDYIPYQNKSIQNKSTRPYSTQTAEQLTQPFSTQTAEDENLLTISKSLSTNKPISTTSNVISLKNPKRVKKENIIIIPEDISPNEAAAAVSAIVPIDKKLQLRRKLPKWLDLMEANHNRTRERSPLRSFKQQNNNNNNNKTVLNDDDVIMHNSLQSKKIPNNSGKNKIKIIKKRQQPYFKIPKPKKIQWHQDSPSVEISQNLPSTVERNNKNDELFFENIEKIPMVNKKRKVTKKRAILKTAKKTVSEASGINPTPVNTSSPFPKPTAGKRLTKKRNFVEDEPSIVLSKNKLPPKKSRKKKIDK